MDERPTPLTPTLAGALYDLATVGVQPSPRTGDRLVAMGLARVAGERLVQVARVDRRRAVPRYALTAEGERVARLTSRSITGLAGGRP